MVTPKTWTEFRKTGLVVIINQLLHVFGWAIVFEVDDNSGVVTSCYPARVKFRGFSEAVTDDAYKKVSQYMEDTASELNGEAKS